MDRIPLTEVLTEDLPGRVVDRVAQTIDSAALPLGFRAFAGGFEKFQQLGAPSPPSTAADVTDGAPDRCLHFLAFGQIPCADQLTFKREVRPDLHADQANEGP